MSLDFWTDLCIFEFLFTDFNACCLWWWTKSEMHCSLQWSWRVLLPLSIAATQRVILLSRPHTSTEFSCQETGLPAISFTSGHPGGVERGVSHLYCLLCDCRSHLHYWELSRALPARYPILSTDIAYFKPLPSGNRDLLGMFRAVINYTYSICLKCLKNCL